MQITLEFFNRHGQVKPIVVDEETVVGRGETCQLKVGSELVSREHCILRLHDGSAWLEDLGSTNGTFLNGTRLSPHAETPLIDGAEVLIGPARARVRYDRAEADAIPITHLKSSAIAKQESRPQAEPPEATSKPAAEPADESVVNAEAANSAAERHSGMDTCGSNALETAGGKFQSVNAADDLESRQTVSNVDDFVEPAESTFTSDSIPQEFAIPEGLGGSDQSEPDDDLHGFLQQFE